MASACLDSVVMHQRRPVAALRRVVCLVALMLGLGILITAPGCAAERSAKPRTVEQARAYLMLGRPISELEFWLTTPPLLIRGAPHKLWKAPLADGELWYTTSRTLLDRTEVLETYRLMPSGTTQDEGKLLFPGPDSAKQRPFEVFKPQR